MPAWIDECVSSVMEKKTKEFKDKNGREPNEEEKKEMTSSAFAICQSQYKQIKKSEKTAEFELVGDFQKFNFDNELYIYGPASVEVLDRQNDIMKMDAIENALPDLLKRARITLDHRDMMIGEIILSKELSGNMYETGVRIPNDRDLELFPYLPKDEKSLFVFGKIWSDTSFCKSAIDFINNNEYNSFSLAGRVVSYNRICDTEKCYRLVNKLNLSSVAIVRDGANPLAKFKIVKSADEDLDDVGEEMTTDIQKENKPKENVKDENPQTDVADTKAKEPKVEATYITKEDFDGFKKEIVETISKISTEKKEAEQKETPKTDPITPVPKVETPAPEPINVDKIAENVIEKIKKDFTVVHRTADAEKPKKTWKELIREFDI